MILLGLAACASGGVEGWVVSLHGRFVDAAGVGLPEARVRFSSEEGLSVGETRTDDDGAWTLPVFGTELTGNTLVARVESDGLADLRAHFDVNLRTPLSHQLAVGPGQTIQAGERRLPTLALAEEDEVPTVEGQVVDAITGAPVGGIPLSLHWGWNAPLGEPSEGEGVTDADGRFAFTAWPAGWYTVEVAPTEVYDPARFPAYLTGAGGQARGVVSPHVAAGQLRASLVWASTPADLDLHLSAPLKGDQAGEDGNGQFHVYAGEPTHPDGDAGDGVEASLERADGDGLGPETVALYGPPGTGELRLSVVDMDHLADPANLALGASGAVIQVWSGADLARFYTVSPGETATWWRPMSIDVESGVVYQTEEYAVNVNPADADAF